jgi:SAM-dependent methyltransferase
MKLCPVCSEAFVSANWDCPFCGGQPRQLNGFFSFAPELSSDDGFKDVIFQELVELESRNFWFQARNRLILWALSIHFPNATSFLEVGCGTGFVLSGVASARPKLKLSGSEISSAGLSHAAKRVPSAELIQMDARSIPFDTEFDAIGAFDVLEHIEEDEAVLREIHSALVAGGGAIFTVPQHPWMWSSADDYACHVRRYRVGELREKLVRAGFRIEMETSFVSLLLPVMFVSRWLKRNAPVQDACAELKLPTALNQLFSSVMTIEHSLIKAALRFPFGGSRLLVVRKVK